MELLMEFMGKGLILMLTISLPCVLTAASIGLVVGILQAVTQVQEQTIAAAPKITAVFMVIIIGGSFFVSLLTGIFQEAVQLSFNVVPKQENYVLPADYYKYTKPFSEEMRKDSLKNIPSVDEVMQKAGDPPIFSPDSKIEYYPAKRVGTPTPNFVERKQINGQ